MKMEVQENEETTVLSYKWELPLQSLADPNRIHALTIGLPDGRKAYFMRRDDWYSPEEWDERYSKERRLRSDLSAVERNPALDCGTQSSDRSV
jgi:hypothetical protein